MNEVSITKFIRLWMSELPTSVIAEKLDRTTPWVYQTANKLRAVGVKLPKRQVLRRARRYNVDYLNAYIEKLSE